MLVDYTFETVRQADVYARLPDIGDHDINATGPHWYFELQPVNPETLPLFIQSRSTLAEAAGLNPDDFVDIVLSCPNLTRHQVRSSWPKSLLLGNQKAPVMNASNTILVWKLLSTFGTDWKKTIAEGQPFQPLTQSRPGHVHIRDVVVYRIIKQALLENGLKMKIVPDPNVALVGSSTAELHLRDSSAPMYCANTRCTVLGIPKGHCKRCSVGHLPKLELQVNIRCN